MAEAFISTEALVLREVKYKEADRILTLLTPKYGKITAKASNALRKTSKIAAGTQALTYADLVLYNSKGRYLVREAGIREEFRGLREDFSLYALGCYFSECVESLTEDNTPDPAVLQLISNSLYALSRHLHSPELVKAAFEMRLMRLTGYAPDVGMCALCHEEHPKGVYLGTESGHIWCRSCRPDAPGPLLPLSTEALEALRHILNAPAKSFIPPELPETAAKELQRAAEEFFLLHAGRRFPTLDYWKRLS